VGFFKVINTTRGSTLASRIHHATRFWDRARGLVGRSALEPEEGLLIKPCSWIHTFGMRFPIDVLYLNGDNRILSLNSIFPNRFGRPVRGATAVLELALGGIARSGTQVGDQLEIRQWLKG
jgi:uncharacterized membrane protein (UPF0127 family)